MRPDLSCRSQKDHLAHAPLGHEPPGQRDLAASMASNPLDGGAVVGDLIFGDLEGVTPPLLELLQLVPADLKQLGQVLLLRNGVVILIGMYARTPISFSPASGVCILTALPSAAYTHAAGRASTTTSSPTFSPAARPKGESSEMTPFMGSASWEPTIL